MMTKQLDATEYTDEALASDAILMKVTPRLAAEWLQYNPGNRRLSQRHVQTIAAAITAGEWKVNGDTIKLSIAGELLDGQHRCQAVITTGIAITSYVVRLAHDDRETRATLDSNKHRNLADTLHIEGYTSTIGLSATLTTICAWQQKRMFSRDWMRPSHAEMLALADKYKAVLPDYQHRAQRLRKVTGCPDGLGCALLIILSEVDPTMAELFFENLIDGSNLRTGDPVLLLRNFLLERRSRQHIEHDRIGAYFIGAWNAVRSGRTLARLAYQPSRMKMPEPI